MKRVVVDHFGGPEVLRIVEDETPRPAPGVDVVLDGMGGALSLRSFRRHVLAYRIQALREGHPWIPVASRRRAPAVGGGPRNPQWFREDFRSLLDLLRRGRIHPVVAQRLPLAQARHAHELLESSAGLGKLVLLP